MSIEDEATALRRQMGGLLADQVSTLRPAQKRLLAQFVCRYNYLEAIQALYVNPDEMERCMIETGHRQCALCEQWFANEVMRGKFCEACEQEVT